MNVHELDQMVAAIRDIAKVLFEHNKRLKEAGFTEEEALEMTIKLQNELFRR